MEYLVNLNWDSEAYVWIATSENVKGLAMEAGSVDALMERVKNAVPELLELNCGITDPTGSSIRFVSQRVERLRA